jgi:uncharacterized protein (DUF427 family)
LAPRHQCRRSPIDQILCAAVFLEPFSGLPHQTIQIFLQVFVWATVHQQEKNHMARAVWGGKVIAESNDTVVVEGNQYFPPDAVTKDFLKTSMHTSICPWKGTAHYYHLEVDGMKNENAAWYYPEPKPAAEEIKGRIAFWKGVRVEPGKS